MSTREERMRGIEAAVFRTITDADWARELRRARGVANGVSAQIRERARGAGGTQKILALSLGDSESGNLGKSSS